MIQRITELNEMPVVGRFYLVPTVEHPWTFRHKPFPWPVFLPRHNDTQFFNFPEEHYHVDPRFLTPRDFAIIEDYGWSRTAFEQCQGAPVAKWNAGAGAYELSAIVWRRRRCHRDAIPYAFGEREPIKAIQAHWSGQTAPRNRYGWVCPHQSAALGSMAVVDGVITCPLHGMRIRTADGMCLSA
jgi:hypothetical protein